MKTTTVLLLVVLWTDANRAAEQAPCGQTFVNSVGMKMVRIEPGSFRMGSPEGETMLPSDQWDEQPLHEVTITQPFHMAATEVTNVQYEQFDPAHHKWRGLRDVSKADDEAVTYVSWHEAAAFCQWLSKKENKPYRLPTEAEWEYACRAGTTTTYWAGENLPEAHYRNQWTETADKRVNAKDRALRDKKGKEDVSLRVGTMPANPWGLHEMHGNLEEWVKDWYGSYAKKGTGPICRNGPEGAAHKLDLSPFSQTDPVGPADGMFKVTRGGSHNTALKFLRAANRSATQPDDKHWLIGFRLVLAPLPQTAPQPAAPLMMNDPSVDPRPATWNEPTDQQVFHEPIPFVRPDKDHPLLSQLHHHHCPTITWCKNGDLLAAWFNTISEIGREMVIVSSRLRYRDGRWADRNTTGSCLLHDGRGRVYFFNAIGDSGHHRDQCLIMSVSEDSGHTWTRPRIISDLFRRHKYTPMDSAFVEDHGKKLVLGIDYAPLGHKANEAGSGVFISPDGGETWLDSITGKNRPNVAQGGQDRLAAGFHINVVRLEDRRLLAMTRNQGGSDINGHITMSYSNDDGNTWAYRESPFPDIGSGQRLVLMRLTEGPLLLVSFDRGGMFASLSFDEGDTWSGRKRIDQGHRGYLAATQTPDHLIHLITSQQYYRFNLVWLKSPADSE